jgi:hypothetical protein
MFQSSQTRPEHLSIFAAMLLPVTRRLTGACSIAFLLTIGCGTIVSQPTSKKVTITRYRGPGFIISYPSYWQREASDKAVSLKAPTQAGQIFFSIGPIAASRDQVFREVRAAHPQVPFGSSEPTLYGAWRGDSISGNFAVNGQQEVMSVTAIQANDIFYGMIMIAPAQVSWDAYELRKALANTLTFDRLASASHGTSGTCSDCAAMLGATMNRLTSQTLDMMK